MHTLYVQTYIKCFVIIIYFLYAFSLNAQSISFKNYTVEDGLSSNKVNTLIQDKTGFIWFGTEDGLNRFDGYNFKVFRHNPSDSNSISDNIIWALLEDHSGNIWVGTKKGMLDQFIPEKNIFIKWDLGEAFIDNSGITYLFEDSRNNLWIGTRYKGLFKLNTQTKKIDHWNSSKYDTLGISYGSIRSIIEDGNNNIIIGTYNGLNKFNPDKPDKGFIKFFYEDDNPNSLSSSQIYNLSRSKTNPDLIYVGTPEGLVEYNSGLNSFERIKIPNEGKLQFGSGASTVIEEFINNEKILWVDTYSGLLRMNMNTGEYFRFVNEERNPVSIVSSKINKILKDKSGIIWIATESGISYYSPKSSRFNSLFNKKYQAFLNAVKDKSDLKAITQNDNGDIWLGFSNGVVKLKQNKSEPEVTTYSILNGLNVWSLTEDNNNTLWIGTFGQGLKQYFPESGRVKNWVLKFSTGATFSPFVKSLFKDHNNNVWVGNWGSGTARINPSSGEYQLWMVMKDNNKSLSHGDVWTIKEDRLGRIWMGTVGGGLNLFVPGDTMTFKHWNQENDSINSISSNNVYSICIAEKGTYLDAETILWLGTNNGLNKFIVKNDTKNIYNINVENIIYNITDDDKGYTINSIIEDEQGNLWLGTESGISFFDIDKKKFSNFTAEDGLFGNVMNPGAAIEITNGLMLFGSNKGLNIFNPNEINLSHFEPEIVFTDFQIFNKPVQSGKNSLIKKNINYLDEIILSNDQDVFSFEFAAIDYNSTASIKYAYKMEGFDNDWIKSGKRRFVTYTNLDPGTYSFSVKSTNADGIWSDKVKTLKVIINPPWWKTIWAYGLYIILIIIGLFSIRKFELNRAKLRNELKLREVEVRKKSELEELKSRFFANLSHEFRTPLMLIKGPLEKLKQNSSNGNSENIELIERNSERLKTLIDQLLELSQLEKASIPLNLKEENLVMVLKGMVASFESLAIQKNIQLNFFSGYKSIYCNIDIDKFEKIINNLLSNAIKFTPPDGRVKVELRETIERENIFAEIIIADTGISIPGDKIDKVFNRFFQVDDSTKRAYGGSGIGLALVKEFVDLHKWDISVKSKKGEGTEFKLLIPVIKSNKEKEEELIKNSGDELIAKDSFEKVKAVENKSVQNKPLILIVDDSEDVRKYLNGLLINDYEICEASNGDEGISAAAESNPDLIISDIMMPSMDGIEFSRRIKSDWQTSDIPIILLTAKASTESKIEGLETGADDYLIKPFESKELNARIRNLLEQRKRIREKYSKDIASTNYKKLNKADDEFMNRVYKFVEENLDKTNFNTDKLAKELNISRTQLHRKITSITGQGPGEFIRTIKLKKAASLLLDGELSVTQIAYEIGFSSPAQFSRAFQKQFNCLPSDFLSQYKS